MGCLSSASPTTKAVRLTPHGFFTQEPLGRYHLLDTQPPKRAAGPQLWLPSRLGSGSQSQPPTAPCPGLLPLMPGAPDPASQRNLSQNGLPEVHLSVAQEEIPSWKTPWGLPVYGRVDIKKCSWACHLGAWGLGNACVAVLRPQLQLSASSNYSEVSGDPAGVQATSATPACKELASNVP